jgi:hypothetical protein
VDDARTFQPGVLGRYDSVKGFAVIGSDGRAGRVSWASFAPGESYLVVTTGMLRQRHRLLPAGAITSVGEGRVQVALSRAEIEHLPLLPDPQAPVADETVEQMLNAFERSYAATFKQ